MGRYYEAGAVFVGMVTRILPDGITLQVGSLHGQKAYFPVYGEPKGKWKVGDIVRCTVSTGTTYVCKIEKIGWLRRLAAFLRWTRRELATMRRMR